MMRPSASASGLIFLRLRSIRGQTRDPQVYLTRNVYKYKFRSTPSHHELLVLILHRARAARLRALQARSLFLSDSPRSSEVSLDVNSEGANPIVICH